MIKRLSILICLLISCAFAYVETPILVNTGALNVETVENANDLIKTDMMKKSPSIEKVKKEMSTKQPPVIKLDVNQIQHQRALDYMDHKTGSMVPRF